MSPRVVVPHQVWLANAIVSCYQPLNYTNKALVIVQKYPPRIAHSKKFRSAQLIELTSLATPFPPKKKLK